MPKVTIVDMKEEILHGNYSVFSDAMSRLIQHTLDEHNQMIILLNRRGYSTFVMCRDCGETIMCPHCDVAMVYHQAGEELRCHYCEHHEPIPTVCPKCNSKRIKFFGSGTQKVEEELRRHFKSARIARLDQDVTKNKQLAEDILHDFGAHKYDILLGTQMVSKGHDFKDVTAVGILTADSVLNIPVYTTARIHAGINRSYCMTEKLSSSVRYLEKQEPMTLEDFHIESFEVPHDGTDNVGYCIEIDGKVFSFLTDLGEITPTAAHYISKAHYLILEANYDEEMLKMGPYPQYLKERIASKTGHMSNSDTAEFLAENITEHLRYIWLCHLSKDNNHPELAYKTVEWKLKNKGILVGKDVQLLALKRNTPSELYVFE